MTPKKLDLRFDELFFLCSNLSSFLFESDSCVIKWRKLAGRDLLGWFFSLCGPADKCSSAHLQKSLGVAARHVGAENDFIHLGLKWFFDQIPRRFFDWGGFHFLKGKCLMWQLHPFNSASDPGEYQYGSANSPQTWRTSQWFGTRWFDPRRLWLSHVPIPIARIVVLVPVNSRRFRRHKFHSSSRLRGAAAHAVKKTGVERWMVRSLVHGGVITLVSYHILSESLYSQIHDHAILIMARNSSRLSTTQLMVIQCLSQTSALGFFCSFPWTSTYYFFWNLRMYKVVLSFFAWQMLNPW